jgi:DNA-binding IclR family transcriptional regulator
MSVAAVRRSFLVIHHLMTKGETRFMDLAEHLFPISRTGLSHLLASLQEVGELEHDGRSYRLAPTSVGLMGNRQSIYSLPPALLALTRPILRATAGDLSHSCALFARVGDSTMKLVDVHNLPAPHCAFPALGHECPMLPFHGFARLFLAHGSENTARECYRFWQPYLQANGSIRLPASENQFLAELARVRRTGHSLEYKEEVQPIMRVAVPVEIPGIPEVRFAIGLVANFVYLLEVESQVARLRRAAEELAAVLQKSVPSHVFSSGSESPWRAADAASLTEGSEPWPAHAIPAERERIAS